MKKNTVFLHLISLLLALLCLWSCSQEKVPPNESGEPLVPLGDRSYDDYVDENGNSRGSFYVIRADLVDVAKDYERSWYICDYEGYRVKIDEPLPAEFDLSVIKLEITYNVSDLSVSEDGKMYIIAKTEHVCRPTSPTPGDFSEMTYDKPVIYLYPETTTEIDVRIDFKGEFTVTIPKYRDGWTVTASPDGTLIGKDGKKYPYLFWEGIPERDVLTITEGFCIRGEDTEAFLYEALPRLGLIESEYVEFIDFWLPRMEGNAYNLIRFNDPAYMDMANMDISPAPQTLIRVFMSYAASDVLVDIPEQQLITPERIGFTAVEWGGCELK
ncbi:MAG: hypothetical protein IJW40_02530 [Clostridia bacterium]|nr:hypothetical protein [Clostridia bacterium]